MSGRRWTAKEDEIVRTYPTKAAILLLRDTRTKVAVRDRRRKFGPNLARTSWVNRPWTSDEDEIVRSNPIKAAVDLLSASRTEVAVRLRRRNIGIAIPRNIWTKTEDRRIRRTAFLPLSKIIKLFKNRSAKAIGVRRQRLGCQQKLGLVNRWKGVEVTLLRKMWPTCKISAIVDAIPRHTIESIRSKAAELGIRKAREFGGSDVLDQIKARTGGPHQPGKAGSRTWFREVLA